MGSKTTTIAEADVLLREELDLLQKSRPHAFEKKEEGARGGDEEGPAAALQDSGQEIIWTNVVLITALHVLAVYILYAYTFSTKIQTIAWGEWTFRTGI